MDGAKRRTNDNLVASKDHSRPQEEGFLPRRPRRLSLTSVLSLTFVRLNPADAAAWNLSLPHALNPFVVSA